MTNKEAIKYLKNGCLTLACEHHIFNKCELSYEERNKRKDEAIGLAVKALKECGEDRR